MKNMPNLTVHVEEKISKSLSETLTIVYEGWSLTDTDVLCFRLC